MINGGFSIAIGQGHKRVDIDVVKRMENMEKEIAQLKKQNQELLQAVEKILLLDKAKKSSFKDIPEGHWAKEAVEVLKGNGVLEGYPDGEFKGDREMTRYEYSQMLEKALTKK